jgi:hypothetical protein
MRRECVFHSNTTALVFVNGRSGKAQRARFSCSKCLKDEEANHDRLSEEKDGIKLMIALVSCNRGCDHACEVQDVTNIISRP